MTMYVRHSITKRYTNLEHKLVRLINYSVDVTHHSHIIKPKHALCDEWIEDNVVQSIYFLQTNTANNCNGDFVHRYILTYLLTYLLHTWYRHEGIHTYIHTYISVGNNSRPGCPEPTLHDQGIHLSIVAGPVVLLIFNIFYALHGK